MNQEKMDQLMQTGPVIIPTCDLSDNSNPLEITKTVAEWVSKLPLDFRKNHKFVIDVQGKSVFHDLVKETIEIRQPSLRFSVDPFNS
jgi:hypothetical protein